MEPVSIVMMVNASLGIARSLVHTINELYELAEAYETAAVGIRTVATQCSSFKIAIDRIHKWLQGQQNHSRSDLDDDFWGALKQNLDTGGMVIDDLNRRIEAYKKTPAKFWTRTKYLWNHGIISELQSQIQGLMSALGLLIQVIDLPNKGVPRSLSRAQSTRLNGLTRSARSRVDAQRRRQLEAAQSGDEEAILTQQLLDSKQEEVLVAAIDRPDTSETAPPPYTIGGNDDTGPGGNDEAAVRTSDTAHPLTKVSSEADAQDDWNLRKPKGRPIWKTMWIRTNKSDKTTKTRKSFLPQSKDVKVTSTDDTAAIQDASPVASPDNMSASSNTNYFELQNAVAGLHMEQALTRAESAPEANSAIEIQTSHELTSAEVHSPEALTSPKEELLSNNPYAAMRLASRSKSQTDFYEQHRKDSADKFNRIRPSQRVLEARRPSPPSSPEQDNLSRTSSRSRIGDMTLSSAAGFEQSWQTTATTNRAIKVKVVFEKDSFTNKMSASAARVLGVDDAIEIVDGIALANLTLLHAVGSNDGSDDTVVNGEEVEFEVMNEHESRVTELHLGQGLAHLASLMESGEYIYWNPRSIPDKLRTVDRLRLYRRFELVRW